MSAFSSENKAVFHAQGGFLSAKARSTAEAAKEWAEAVATHGHQAAAAADPDAYLQSCIRSPRWAKDPAWQDEVSLFVSMALKAKEANELQATAALPAFQSMDDITAAMSDPRYRGGQNGMGRDPAYIRAVEDSIAAMNAREQLAVRTAEADRPASTAQPFRSAYERQQAMTDRRYKLDAAYRDDVAARLLVTPDGLE